MTEHAAEDTASAPVATIGARLRAAREAKGLSIAQVAEQTRIAQRHLAAIESGNLANLPGRTYALGFTRTYARLVGIEPEEAVAAARVEMDLTVSEPAPRAATFEPGDPARLPSVSLGWLSVFAVVALLVAGYFLLPRLFVPAAQLPSLFEQQAREEAEAAASASASANAAARAGADSPAAGPVVFTALEDGIWVKFYDGSGRQLMQKLMAKGETYTVPEDADAPQLWTGRPDALSIAIGGRQVPPITTEQRTVRDVAVSREALLGRAAPPAAAPPAAANPAAAGAAASGGLSPAATGTAR